MFLLGNWQYLIWSDNFICRKLWCTWSWSTTIVSAHRRRSAESRWAATQQEPSCVIGPTCWPIPGARLHSGTLFKRLLKRARSFSLENQAIDWLSLFFSFFNSFFSIFYSFHAVILSFFFPSSPSLLSDTSFGSLLSSSSIPSLVFLSCQRLQKMSSVNQRTSVTCVSSSMVQYVRWRFSLRSSLSFPLSHFYRFFGFTREVWVWSPLYQNKKNFEVLSLA